MSAKTIVEKAVHLAENLDLSSTKEQWDELENLKIEMSYEEFKSYLAGIEKIRLSNQKNHVMGRLSF